MTAHFFDSGFRGEIIVSLLLQATVVCLAAMAIARLVFARYPAARHGVLCCGLLMLWLGPLWTASVNLGGLPRFQLLPQGMVASVDPADSRPAGAQAAQSGAPGNLSPRWSSGQILLAIWAAGCVLLLVRLGYGWSALRRLRHDAGLADRPDLVPNLADVCQALHAKHLPEVLVSRRVSTPLTCGIWRPCVLLPEHLAREITSGELRQVLAHECAHAMRRDPAVALLQELTRALLWIHPLVYLLNRELSQAREEVCDNHVLSLADGIGYSRTLLHVAESMKGEAGVLSVALLRWQWPLEDRIRDILSRTRICTTRANPWAIGLSSVLLGTIAIVAGCAGAVTRPPQDSLAAQSSTPPGAWRGVQYEIGYTGFRDGDSITIHGLDGTSEMMQPGGTYKVSGHYKLASAEVADLAFFVTVTEGSGLGPVDPAQCVTVHRGEGDFSLVMRMTARGYPHLSFYPLPSGGSFGDVYFGQGESILRRKCW